MTRKSYSALKSEVKCQQNKKCWHRLPFSSFPFKISYNHHHRRSRALPSHLETSKGKMHFWPPTGVGFQSGLKASLYFCWICCQSRWTLSSVELLKTSETSQEQVRLLPHHHRHFSLFSQSKLGFVIEEEITWRRPSFHPRHVFGDAGWEGGKKLYLLQYLICQRILRLCRREDRRKCSYWSGTTIKRHHRTGTRQVMACAPMKPSK